MRDEAFKKDYGDDGLIQRFLAGASQSGHERDHLFYNRRGKDFVELSGVSGLDHPADGRAMAILDYDRDGLPDFAVANANRPLFLLYRNRIADRGAERNEFVALRLVGGNHSARPAPGWSNRDAIGAQVTLELAGETILRELRAGEGFGAQNSSTLLVGIGKHDRVDRLKVRWPSGRTTEVADVAAGSLVTVHEDPEASPSGDPAVMERYRRPRAPSPPPRVTETPRLDILDDPAATPPGELRMYFTMATWCLLCRGEIPTLKRLRETFSEESLYMAGVPVDPEDSPEKLAAYERELSPPYEMLATLPRERVERVQRHVIEALNVDALPATIVTDREGRVIHTMFGVPSVSDIRSWLAGVRH